MTEKRGTRQNDNVTGTAAPGVVWQADEATVASSVTGRFMVAHGIDSYPDLVRRSIDEPEWFWDAVVTFLGIPFQRPYTHVADTTNGPAWTTWFADGAINLSAVCVDRWAQTTPDAIAIIMEDEDGGSRRLTYAQLQTSVNEAAAMLRSEGVVAGSTVAVYLPLCSEAVVSFLAVARLGAIFVPVFSGFGAAAVATRLIDAKPSMLITADGFRRRGRPIVMKGIADEAVRLAAEAGVVVPRSIVVYHERTLTVPIDSKRERWWHDALARVTDPLTEAVITDAETPVLLAYTSGTTGKPKGAVHVHGGFTVKIAEEAAFQTDLQPGDSLCWITDMGWIMGPWVTVGALANGATVVLFDGAPDWPTPGRLWEVVAKHEVTVLGVSPTLVRALKGAGDQHLPEAGMPSSLRAFASTGEPWNAEPWWWLFERVGNRARPIINISGGTEAGACLLSVNLLQGIKPVALGGPALGMAVDVFADDGTSLLRPDGTGNPDTLGELVVTKAWPGTTRGIWNDPNRYLNTYWSRFTDIWVHGDWASVDEDGFWSLHGRSDDTLNIAGKRIGPAEFESSAVACDGVVMAAAIGVPDEVKGEVVVLYCVARPDADLGALDDAVRTAVVVEFGRPFSPKHVFFVADLPRTRSQKIVRRAIRARALGTDPGDLSTLENPEALELITRVNG